MKHKINKNPTYQLAFTAIIYTVEISYLGIMISMTIDRLWAVFRPCTYSQNWKRPMIILALWITFGIVFFMCARMVDIILGGRTVQRGALSIFVVLTYVLIIGSYAAILWKLRRQRRVCVTEKVFVSFEKQHL